MGEVLFHALYNTVKIGTIVCEKAPDLPVIYMNSPARLLLNPSLSTENLGKFKMPGPLKSVLSFSDKNIFAILENALRNTGWIDKFSASILTPLNESIPVALYANAVRVKSKEYFVIYIAEEAAEETGEEEVITRILASVYHSGAVDNAIQDVLNLTGSYINVSRVYIFEEISALFTRNTYEWCNAGVAPAIQDLQYLAKSDYNYDTIMSAGMFITNDVRTLPKNDRDILEPQGIKSIAILPLFHQDKPLGYLGFDDCEKYRTWSRQEIQLLRGIAGMISSLLNRRNAEREAIRSREILQTITDNSDAIIYVNNIATYEILFINKKIIATLGKPAEEIIGKKCWQALQANQTGPCPFCPIPKLVDKDGNILAETYIWETKNTIDNSWYLARDGIVKWIDGENVHIETAVDITYSKEYEAQLKTLASTDSMTHAFNREWGYSMILKERKKPNGKHTLCFIDIDGLKYTNDHFGHAAGDELLKQTSAIIRANIRKDDLFCRWGGDEFLLVLNCSKPEAETVMQKIQKKMDKINNEQEKPYILALSYGLVDFADAGDNSLDAIISSADALMYRQKVLKRQKP